MRLGWPSAEYDSFCSIHMQNIRNRDHNEIETNDSVSETFSANVHTILLLPSFFPSEILLYQSLLTALTWAHDILHWSWWIHFGSTNQLFDSVESLIHRPLQTDSHCEVVKATLTHVKKTLHILIRFCLFLSFIFVCYLVNGDADGNSRRFLMKSICWIYVYVSAARKTKIIAFR